MKYGSVCSGIEAATVAWEKHGFQPAFYSEIEPFPCALLAHHYPQIPNLGDMTRFQEWPNEPIDLLVGGTPCQSFSLAGLRKGLTDPRGNLMLTFGAIASKYRPKWLVWENVPGVLSSNGGRDFGTFLGMLGQLGYGFSYRVLDAQYFGVAQRRRRVFVVGYFGDWRPAATVLFEHHSLSGDSAPRREAGQEVAPTIRAGAPNGSPSHGQRSGDTRDELIVPEVAKSLLAAAGPCGRMNASTENFICGTLQANGKAAGSVTQQDAESGMLVAHNLRAQYDASEDGTGRGTPPVAQAVSLRGREGGGTAELGGQIQNALRASGGGGDKAHVLSCMAVRRLTPRECERLQGFPDDYTLIPHGHKIRSEKLDQDFLKYQLRGNPKHITRQDIDRLVSDGPRYKALGNSMAVPVMEWIGKRIKIVERLIYNGS